MKLGIHLPQYGRAASPDATRRVAVRAVRSMELLIDIIEPDTDL